VLVDAVHLVMDSATCWATDKGDPAAAASANPRIPTTMCHALVRLNNFDSAVSRQGRVTLILPLGALQNLQFTWSSSRHPIEAKWPPSVRQRQLCEACDDATLPHPQLLRHRRSLLDIYSP
jgi:hypothetical protein